MRILIIEDDEKLTKLVDKMLAKEGYACEAVHTIARAKDRIGNSSSEFDAIILDVGLPDGVMGNSEVGHNAIGSGRVFDQGALLAPGTGMHGKPGGFV